MNAKRN